MRPIQTISNKTSLPALIFYIRKRESSLVMQTCNPKTLESEVGET